MAEEITKLYFNEMTQQKMYKTFGLRKVSKIESLDSWLSNLPSLTAIEKSTAQLYQNRLLKNIDNWNEQELSLGFIGPIINLIDFKVPYLLNFFAQRPLIGTVDGYELIGKPDGILAGGNFEPETPYFSFQEYKKDVNSSGDPAGQNLAAMLVGQQQNENKEIIYGCYIVGRLWYFMVLDGKEYAISKSYSADDEAAVFEIIQVLKALRTILFERLGIE